MYSERAGPLKVLGPRRVRQPAVPFDDLPPISTVLLSHNHYDHCDLRTLGLLAQRFDPVVVTPLGNGALVRSSGIRRVEELDWWQEAKTLALPITLTPAQHFSVGMHFGTFQLTTEGINEPLLALEDACRNRKIPPLHFRTLGFGESMRLA
jgi:L-ascorbate metabolism protein UlaG (beta-lactamase superfamily)